MKREKYIDIIKGICIICVLYVHINIVVNNKLIEDTLILFSNFISQFFLPVFFIISGFFLKNIDSFFIFIKTKIKKFYIKYLKYYLIFVWIHNFLITIGIYSLDIDYGNKIMKSYSCKEILLQTVKSIFLAGREPILGAVWFFSVLIIAMIGLSIVTTIIKNIQRKFKIIDKEELTFLILFLGLTFSIFCTEILDITVPRVNNSISAMILIYIGYYLNNVKKIEFNNIYLFFISLIIVITNTIFIGKIEFNSNRLKNPLTFLITSVGALYVLGVISKKIENKKISKYLSCFGKYSFYIMFFHLLAFKIGTFCINVVEHNALTNNIYKLTPTVDSIFEFLIYSIVGIILPIILGIILEVIENYLKLKLKFLKGKIKD